MSSTPVGSLLFPARDGRDGRGHRASLDAVVATLPNPLGAGIRWGVAVPGTKAGPVGATFERAIRQCVHLGVAAGPGFASVHGRGVAGCTQRICG